MQSDPLPPQQDDQQSESPSLQDATHNESTSAPVATPPTPAPAPMKKPSKRNIAAIALGLFSLVLILIVAGLGFWAFTLNGKLTETQKQLTALQEDHSKLQTDYATLKKDKDKLTADLTQTKTDLEKATTDLDTTKTSLTKAQDENKALNAKLRKAGKLADILYALYTSKNASDVIKIDAMVKTSDDAELKTKWSKFTANPSPDAYADVFVYLIDAIHKSLK